MGGYRIADCNPFAYTLLDTYLSFAFLVFVFVSFAQSHIIYFLDMNYNYVCMHGVSYRVNENK